MPRHSFPGVYVEERPSTDRGISPVATAVPIFIGYTQHNSDPNAPKQVDSFSAFTDHFGGDPAQSSGALLAPALWQFFLNDGGAALVLSIGLEGDPVKAQDILAALIWLEGVPEGTLLLCPDAVRLSPADRAEVNHAMLAHCAKTRRRFAILDVIGAPDDKAVGEFRESVGNIDLDWGAAYAPMISTSINGVEVKLPPSGATAGVYARTDGRWGVWKAPAGVEASVTGVTGLAADISDQDQQRLLGNGGKSINPIRKLDLYGNVVWGARTLSGDPDFKYVPTRRLAIFIEQSITRSLNWTVFEPNDEPLWRSVKDAIAGFLTALWREGALMGTTSDQAFNVRVGLGETMTQEDIDAGRMIIQVAVAPVRPAEFIIIQIEQMMPDQL